MKFLQKIRGTILIIFIWLLVSPQVVGYAGTAGSQMCRPYGAPLFSHRYPGLTAWARLFRPCGTPIQKGSIFFLPIGSMQAMYHRRLNTSSIVSSAPAFPPSQE